MFQSRSSSRAALVLLGATSLTLVWQRAEAGSCGKDPSCVRAFMQAEAATTTAQRLSAIGVLRAEHARIQDPRLLVTIGKLEHAVAQHDKAKADCQLAQSQAPADVELQRQARNCLDKVTAALNANSNLPAPTPSEKNSGSTRPRVDVRTLVDVKPVITVNPDFRMEPKIQLIQSFDKVSHPEPQGLSKRWWLWSGIGLLAAGAVGLGVGLGVGLAGQEPSTDGFVKYPLALVVK